jgi:hypothetical protein
MRLSFAAGTACGCAFLFGTAAAFAQEPAPIQPPPPMNPAPAPIAPPPPMNPGAPGTPGAPAPAAEADTTRKLDEAEQKDSGRGFELFYLDGQIGGSYINMEQFSSTTFQIEKASAGGPMFSLGAGVRLFIFTAGVRARYNALSSFNMWQLDGELGLKVPISSLDFLIGLHGGYSFVGRLGDAAAATNPNTPLATDVVSIRGFNGGLDIALDYYVSSTFSVGVGVLADFLLLKRPPVAPPANFNQLPVEQQNAIKSDPLYQQSGTSAGLQLAGGLRLGLHFGL